MLETKITALVRQAAGGHADDCGIVAPENSQFGHYTTNAALKLARARKKPPMEIAAAMKRELERHALFQKIEVASPGFINMWLNEKTLRDELNTILRQGNRYGSSTRGRGKTVIVDYSSPNVAKPMNVGHLRSTIIGQTLVNLLQFEGFRVIGDSHVGDWGTQFGTLIVAFKKWGDEKQFKKDQVAHLVALYIRFHREAETHETLFTAAREATRALQAGDKANRTLWRIFVKASMREFNRTYKRLGVRFDKTLGESFYEPLLAGVVADAMSTRVARRDEGAIKIFFDNRLPPFVIEKSDGSHLYSTTDLATAKYRMATWKPEKILYVVANEQALHFEQLFEAIARIGYAHKDRLTHVKFGMVLGESGKKFSTRRGEFVKLDELLDKAVRKAARVNKAAAEAVGIGAIKYRVLSYARTSDIVFDWNEMLNLKGNSGPYLQYTHARLKRVLRKGGGTPARVDFSLLGAESETVVMRELIYFPGVVMRAAASHESNALTEYLFRMANALNAFYEKEPILKAPQPLRNARLGLIRAATIVLKQGLTLLGIATPTQM